MKTHRTNRKSQIVGQIFIYILVAVVIGGIVLVGYWAINGILKRMCEVEQINFKIDFEKALRQSNTFGSTAAPKLSAPCEYTQVCLADASQIGNTGFNCPGNKIVEGSVRDNQRMNIFIANKKTTYPVGFSDYIQLEPSNSCLCVNATNSKFYFTLQGKGQTTLVKMGSMGGN